MKVQFLAFPGCPSADGALAVLERVLDEFGVAQAIEQVDTTAPETAEDLRDWASPTILINGRDAGGERQAGGQCCRLYTGPDGRMSGIPSEALIAAAVQRVIFGC